MNKFFNKISILGLIVAVTVSTNSCRKDFEEINTNPNSPTIAPTSSIANSATKELLDATRGTFSSGRMFLPWVQYSAQTNYTEEDRYRFRENVNQSLYRDYYLVAQDYKKILELNSNPETATSVSVYGSNNNQIAMSRIMLSYIFSQLVDIYGDVPYYSYGTSDDDFQALDVDKYPKPKFASQEKIYIDILNELKEAADMMDLSTGVFTGEATNGDRIFLGNSLKWKKFANSLRLRIANRVKGVIPTAQQHITEAIASGVMTSNQDNAEIQYQTGSSFAAPLYVGFVSDARNDFNISDTFIGLLKGEKGNFGIVDPRIRKMASPKGTTPLQASGFSYTESQNLSDYVGMPYGVVSSVAPSQFENGKTSLFSFEIMRPDAKLVFMEYSEVEFLLSEVNGFDQTHYINGIKASMEKWGVSSSDISAYIASVPAANQENVMTQKYIALFMLPMEAWSEYRRTGYPNFLLKPGQTNQLIVPDVDGNTSYVFESLVSYLVDVPARVTYPQNLATLNGDNYSSAQSAIGGDKMNTKLIWDIN